MKQQIVEMTLNGSGVRDIARVLHVSTSTVMSELKKNSHYLKPVNQKLLNQLQPQQVEVRLEKVEQKAESEVEESELSGNVELRG